MNEALQNLMTRRSIRSYQPKQVEKELLEQVLEAGTYAPTGGGRQTPVIVAVQDPETVKQLARMNAAVEYSTLSSGKISTSALISARQSRA